LIDEMNAKIKQLNDRILKGN